MMSEGPSLLKASRWGAAGEPYQARSSLMASLLVSRVASLVTPCASPHCGVAASVVAVVVFAGVAGTVVAVSGESLSLRAGEDAFAEFAGASTRTRQR